MHSLAKGNLPHYPSIDNKEIRFLLYQFLLNQALIYISVFYACKGTGRHNNFNQIPLPVLIDTNKGANSIWKSEHWEIHLSL